MKEDVYKRVKQLDIKGESLESLWIFTLLSGILMTFLVGPIYYYESGVSWVFIIGIITLVVSTFFDDAVMKNFNLRQKILEDDK